MLQLHAVSGGYGAIEVIHGIDLHVRTGESLALLGPNGAGKSTLLAALTGTLPARRGTALMDGADLMRWPSHRIVAHGLALVPEGRHVFAPFSVADNLRLGAVALRDGRRLAARFAYVYALFPRLAERRGQAAGTLSGGEQQMVAVGRALMSDPRVLLLDEPFLGLAPLVVREIGEALKQLRAEGLTMLLVEQKLDIALQCAERACFMIKGRIVRTDTTAALGARPDLSDLYFELARPSGQSPAVRP
jgi:branched-chain amino acid transport system ATP-binding protein